MIVPGFKFAATAAAIKKPGVLDLALMVADTPAAAAGVFTTQPGQGRAGADHPGTACGKARPRPSW